MARKSRFDKQKQQQMTTLYAENISEKKEYYKAFYNICVKNSGKDLNALLNELNKVLQERGEVTRDNVGTKLGEMGKLYPDNSNECLYILNLGLAIKNNNIDKIIKYTKLLKDINDKRKINMKRAEENKDNRRCNNKKESLESRFNVFMNKVLNEEDISDYSKYDFNVLIEYARKNLKKFDQEKYVDFLIKYYKLNSYSKEELIRLRSTLEFFYNGAQESSNRIAILDLNKEEDIKKFNSINVIGKDKLDPSIKKYPKRVLAWKQSKLNKYIALYKKYGDILDRMINYEDLNACKDITVGERTTLNSDYSFLNEYLSEFKSISDCYTTNLLKTYSTNDENRDKMIKRFINKIITENRDGNNS